MNARAFEVLGANGFSTLTGKRVLDLGYGAMAAPHMMAGEGAHVHAVDVDPSLAALYRDESNQGVMANMGPNVGTSVRGTLTLHDGVYASNPRLIKDWLIDGGKGITRVRPQTGAHPSRPRSLRKLGSRWWRWTKTTTTACVPWDARWVGRHRWAI